MNKDGEQIDLFQGDIKRDDDKLELSIDNAVYNIKQGILVEDNVVDSSVYNVKQDSPIQSNDDNSDYDFKHIHFAVTINHNEQAKRTTVMLEDYLVKALQRKHGLSDNTAIRLWLEQAIKDDGRFDSIQPLTRQLKRLIIESLV